MSTNAKPKDGTLRFVIKGQSEGLGTIVIGTICYGGKVAWREAVFLPYPDTEVLPVFAKYACEVWPEGQERHLLRDLRAMARR